MVSEGTLGNLEDEEPESTTLGAEEWEGIQPSSTASPPPPRKPAVQTLSDTDFLPTASRKWLWIAGPQGSNKDLFSHLPGETILNCASTANLYYSSWLIFVCFWKGSIGGPGLPQTCNL